MRIFRQHRFGDWDGVMRDLAEPLPAGAPIIGGPPVVLALASSPS
jgi:hypothetical protein